MKQIMLIQTKTPTHNQSGSNSERSLFEETSRCDINYIYDKMIKETNKVLSKIKSNHQRVMSNDFNNNSRNKFFRTQFSTTNSFMNVFKAKKIDNKTTETLLKEINHESTEKKKKYSTLFNNLQKEAKNMNIKKNHQYTSLRLSKSKSKPNTLKSQQVISPSSSSSKMLSLKSTKNNSMKNSYIKNLVINKSTKTLFQSQNLVNKNNSISVHESVHLETTDEKGKNENIVFSKTSYKFNCFSDNEKKESNCNDKNTLVNQNILNSQSEVDYLKGTNKLIQTNNTTTQAIHKNSIMDNYCTYEKTESNLTKHNCGCNIINNFFCCKF